MNGLCIKKNKNHPTDTYMFGIINSKPYMNTPHGESSDDAISHSYRHRNINIYIFFFCYICIIHLIFLFFVSQYTRLYSCKQLLPSLFPFFLSLYLPIKRGKYEFITTFRQHKLRYNSPFFLRIRTKYRDEDRHDKINMNKNKEFEI